MKKLKKKHIALIAVAVLILFGSIGATAYLLFSNYQNVALFKQAKADFLLGTPESLRLAETQLLQFVHSDSNNESAYIMLGAIAEKNQAYPEQVYYCYMAHRLNPLSIGNKANYIKSLCFARYFDRLENFLAQQELTDYQQELLLYAAGRNGNINKYKAPAQTEHSLADLALLLFTPGKLTAAEKLEALNKFPADDRFLQQEILVARAETYLAVNDTDNAEKVIKKAYDANEFAFAPALGRFYASYRSFGKALTVFEKYLATYHDPAIAIQTAEIYCLLDQADKIAQLRTHYQSDAGSNGMLCCYYLDALTALTKNNLTALPELTRPLRKNIDTPLSAFIFLCADLQTDNAASILASYTALLEHRSYLDLQQRADNMVSDYLKRSLTGKQRNETALMTLAQKLYSRKPEAATAKFILLLQKKDDSINVALLNDALKKFSGDFGIVKIGIEYYLNRDLAESARLLELYKKNFPARSGDITRYEIILALKKKNFDRASELFRKNFSPAISQEYWTFASSTAREGDLLFLSRDKEYGPFCRALLLLKKGDKKSACDILEKADAKDNYDLLFFAAKTLAENNRTRSALAKYAAFPEKSPYSVAVLLNTAEILAETGDLQQAVSVARQAYNLAPALPAAQYCYADKLYKNGNFSLIPDVVNLTASSAYRKEMETLWIAGMQQKIKDCNIAVQREKLRELCRQLLVIAPDNDIALEHLKKLHQMPQ